jgi:HK97 family phage portal protein
MGLRSSVLSWLGKAKTDRIAVWNMPWIGDAALKAGNVPALLDAYRSWVYVCASKNATTFASIPLNLYVAKRAGKKLIVPTKSIDRSKLINIKQRSHLTPYLRKAVEYEEVTEHPFLDLMQNVNDFINQFSLFERTELHLELTGNAYWYIVKGKLGLPVEIWPLDPSRVKIIPDKENFIAGYKYQVGQREIVFDESEIVHFKFPHPSDDYYGMAPLEAVTAAYNINEQMAIYDSHVLKNGGRLEGYFANMGDRRLSEVEFDRLKREIKENYTGSINAGRSPLLDGIEYRPFALPPKDLNFAQGRRWSKEEICNAFGQSLGMWDKDATRANAENAMYMYMKDTILPRV